MATPHPQRQHAIDAPGAAFRELADTAPAILWVTGPDARCVYLSRGWYEYTGQQPEEALGFGWLDIIHPDDRDQAGSVFLEANARKEPFSLDYRLKRADGEYRWAIDAGRPRFADDGSFIGYVGSVIDIHERKKAEQELRTSELWFRQIASNVDAAFTVHDLVARRIVYASPAFERLWGVSPDAFVADRDAWMRLVHPDDRESIERSIAALYEGTGSFDSEYRIVLPDGERWVRGRASVASRDAQGRPLVATGLIEDITDRKTHERQLRVVMNELNHRVKNTLAVVQAIAQQSADKSVQSPELASFLGRFGGRLRALAAAHGLLTHSDWSGASMDALVRSELAMRGVSGDRWLADGPSVNLGPKAALAVHMIVHELATNAGKHGALAGEHGRLEVVWHHPTSHSIELWWTERAERDAGPVAEPPTHQLGFGSRLIEQLARYELGGDIEREWLPSGLRVRLRFDPTEARPIASAPITPPDREDAAGLRVLVVEDFATLAIALCDDIRDSGHRTIGPAPSVEAAEQLLASQSIDAAVLDIDLGGQPSYPLARALRDRGTPFLFLSGYSAEDLPSDLRDCRVIEKPVEPGVLGAWLDSLVKP